MKKLLFSILTIATLGVSAQIGDTVYVNQNATGVNDGTSWADAYTELYDAVANAGSSKQIWVATGTYKPTNIGDRTESFDLSASIYGGFNGTETQLSERDWITNPTILSGDIGTVGVNADNSQSVIRIQYALGGASIVMDGFTISDGYADGTASETRYGGGIYVKNFEHPLTIRNCIIKDNSAHYEGGLLYLSNNGPLETKYLTIENTRFTNNKARYAAAFTVMASDTSIVNVTVVNCLIDDNQTVGFSSSPAGIFPGGRFSQLNQGEVDGLIVNCTFAGNTDNSAFVDSTKSVFGIQNSNDSTVNDIDIYNTIFYGNTINPTYSSIGYGNNSVHKPTNVNVYNSISEDTISKIDYVTSTNNIQVNPLFTDPSMGDFTLQNASPAINLGSTSGLSGLIPTRDLAGAVRMNDSIDLGCYENQFKDEDEEVGIDEQVGEYTLTVYPNPTADQLTIKIEAKEITSIRIINITGETLKTVFSNKNTIDVSDLIKGIYFLQIKTEEGLFTTKFIKD